LPIDAIKQLEAFWDDLIHGAGVVGVG